MTCPFCHGEMQRGVMSGDGRTGVFWKAGERKASLVDQIVGIGAVKAAKRREVKKHASVCNHDRTGPGLPVPQEDRPAGRKHREK